MIGSSDFQRSPAANRSNNMHCQAISGKICKRKRVITAHVPTRDSRAFNNHRCLICFLQFNVSALRNLLSFALCGGWILQRLLPSAISPGRHAFYHQGVLPLNVKFTASEIALLVTNHDLSPLPWHILWLKVNIYKAHPAKPSAKWSWIAFSDVMLFSVRLLRNFNY